MNDLAASCGVSTEGRKIMIIRAGVGVGQFLLEKFLLAKIEVTKKIGRIFRLTKQEMTDLSRILL